MKTLARNFRGCEISLMQRMGIVAMLLILATSDTQAELVSESDTLAEVGKQKQRIVATKEIAFDGSNLLFDTDTYLSQHDVVYLTPGAEGYEGFPLGNGDLGVMAWTPADRLHFQINKCDTWDDGADKSFGAWDDGNIANAYTALRHCGELQIEPGLPMFDWMYLEDFKATLSLADARATWFAKSPLGQVRCSSFVARDPKVIVVTYEDELSEPTIRKVKLARWGTRVFEHWYATIKRGDYVGPAGTKAGAKDNEIWIEQRTRSLKFAVACKIVTDKPKARVYHSRQGGFELEAGDKCKFTLYLSVVTSEEDDNPLQAARQNVRRAAKFGRDALFAKHKAFWDDFWSKSFIDIPDDYIENLWYINVYQAGSSSAGRYPPHFIQSIWSWSRDARPWNHYYHWNQQTYTWPLMSSGHPELLEPYAKWRLEGLPKAMEDARNIHNCKGAFYSDVANRRGYQDVVDPEVFEPTVDSEYLKTYVVLLNYNLTPGAQIAHDLYRHYQYTGDEEFLKKYTYPIMREWVRFMADYVRLEEDGLYHVPKCDPYESPFLRCRDTTNVLAYIRLIFPIFAKLSQEFGTDYPLSQKALEVTDKLVDYLYVQLPAENKTTGEGAAGSHIMAAGTYLKTGEAVFCGAEVDGHQLGAGFVRCAQLTPLFPAGVVGLDQENSKEFQALKNTVLISDEVGPGHNTRMNAMARVGLADRMEEEFKRWVDRYQLFPQGLFCYFTRGSRISDHLNLAAVNKVKVIGKDEYVDIPAACFAHMALEAGSILESTINDMLLGGYSEKIRVFPATPIEWDARFTLHAVGGFVVTSEKQAAQVKYVAVRSKLGKDCCVVNPWGKGTKIRVVDTTCGSEIDSVSSAEVTFATRQDHIYVIERAGTPLSSYKQIKITAKANNGAKRLRKATLGKSRQF